MRRNCQTFMDDKPTQSDTPETDAVLKKVAGCAFQTPDMRDHARKLERERDRLRAEVAELRKDKERLDWLDKNCTRVSDSERYMPRSVYWGGGTHRDIRAAIDAAREGNE